MSAKAHISPSYRWRLGVVAIVLLLFSGAFIYDGWVTWAPAQEIRRSYPERQRIFQLYEQAEQDPAVTWADIADAHGYPDRPVEYTDRDIFIQKLCAGILIPLGLVFGVAFVRSGRRWVAFDETGLHTSGGQHAPWSSLKHVDKARWQTKGIAIVHYDDRGAERTITLDDWKFDREATVAILAAVEDHLGDGADEPGDESPADADQAPAPAPAPAPGSGSGSADESAPDEVPASRRE